MNKEDINKLKKAIKLINEVKISKDNISNSVFLEWLENDLQMIIHNYLPKEEEDE